MDIAIVAIYLIGMIAFGFWGKRRATTQSDFLVAGRRLGPMLYSGTMAAIVLGGASTIGGVGLGYQYGISGMWLVFAIGVGHPGAEPAVRRPDPAAAGLHRQPDARITLRPRLLRAVRRDHVGLHADAVGHLDHRVRDDLRRAVRHRQGARDHPWRRRRDHLLHAGRHVVDHADRLRAVRRQDHRHLLHPAADRAVQDRRLSAGWPRSCRPTPPRSPRSAATPS